MSLKTAEQQSVRVHRELIDERVAAGCEFLHQSCACPFFGFGRFPEALVMITKPVVFTLAGCLLVLSGCSAKNRWFSRKDYSEIQDPFMESEAVADATGGAPAQDRTGRATLGSDGIASTELEGPRPIVRSGSTLGAASLTGSTGGRTSAASYPEDDADAAGTQESSGTRSYSGAGVSDYFNRRASMQTHAASAEAANASASLRSRLTNASPADAAGGVSQSPSVSSKELEGFSSFLQDKTADVSQSRQPFETKVAESEESLNDFASWARETQETWSDPPATANGIPAETRKSVQSASHQTTRSVDAAFDQFSGVEGGAEQETAEPLVRRTTTLKAARERQQAIPEFDFGEDQPTSDSQSASSASEESNPFANPFDEESTSAPDSVPHGTGTKAKKSASNSNRKSSNSIDDEFMMDSGWKPSHISRP
jgi:hypothetical protein